MRLALQNNSLRTRAASQLEVALIALVLLCLPMFEAPKNVFSLLFLFVWLFRSLKFKILGYYCVFDLPILGLLIVLWISPIFSSYSDVITPLNSAPRWTLVALFVIIAGKLNYSRGQLLVIWAALMVGGAVAVAESLYVWHINGKLYPEFRSVGHVNHSSMYTLITLASGLGALYVLDKRLWVLGLIAVLSSLIFLVPSRSLVGGVAITAVLIVAFSVRAVQRRGLRGLMLSTFAGVTLVSAVLLMPIAESYRSELVSRVTGDDFFAGRDKIFNSAWAVWDRHPIIGTGWFSFGTATSEDAVRGALEADGFVYDADVYWHYSHGHNLWTTTLIERGLLGVALLTILLFLYFKIFAPIVFSRNWLDPIDRGAAVGALLVAVGFVVAGLGNTTMINEHGHAGMAFISVAYGYLRDRGLLPRKLK